MKHVNIPVFIPHLGCPNDCVFCNQKRISGTSAFNINEVDGIIKTALETIDPASMEAEIAFFGGSFTGIDRDDMLYLLSVAKGYVDKGKVKSVRLSTRPDYIDREILDILKAHRVKVIELGLQSLDERVLASSKRGHTATQALTACKLIKEYGFTLIGQMMIGLPDSTLEAELYTAELIAKSCDGARVYPTVVLKDTELYEMTEMGKYTPLPLDDSVMRTGEVLEVFASQNKKVIRIGLQATEGLTDSNAVYSEYHPAIGELAENYLYYKRICEGLKIKQTEGKELTVYCGKGCLSKVIGQKRNNKTKLIKNYKLKSVKVVEKNDILGYNIILDIL